MRVQFRKHKYFIGLDVAPSLCLILYNYKDFRSNFFYENIICTYRELMSLGIVRGMREEPTQMTESVVQVHPEGHLIIRFDRTS